MEKSWLSCQKADTYINTRQAIKRKYHFTKKTHAIIDVSKTVCEKATLSFKMTFCAIRVVEYLIDVPRAQFTAAVCQNISFPTA